MQELNKTGSTKGRTFYEGGGICFCSTVLKEDKITAVQAWEASDGTYLFLPPDAQKAAEEEIFREQFCCLLEALGEPVLLFWLRNPGAEAAHWSCDFLPIADRSGSARRTGRVLSFGLPGYELLVSGGTNAASQDGEEVLLTAGEFPITFRSQSQVFQTEGTIRLPLFGEEAGSLKYSLLAEVPEGENFFQLIHAGISYGYLAERDCYGEGMQAENQLCRVTAPLLSASGPLKLKGVLKLNREPKDYQAFAFDSEAPLLCSSFSGLYGKKLMLRPVSGAGLTFAGFPAWIFETENGTAGKMIYELTYSGDYSVEITEETDVLCGISGTEYIKLTPETDWIVRFHPGNPAVLCGEGGLTGPGTTAFISVSGKKQGEHVSPAYYVQPSGSALFYQEERTDELLTHLKWKTADIGKDQIFPIFPWSEYRMNFDDREAVQKIEEKGISPVRLETLMGTAGCFGRPADKEADCPAATSKGLLANVGDHGFTSLTLARNQKPSHERAGYTWVSEVFTRLLLKERLFLPLSGKESMEKLAAGDVRIYVEDWCFDASPASFGEDTAVLFKYVTGYSAAELMEQESMWSSTEYGAQCRRIFKAAAGACYDDSGSLKEAYREFDEIIHNKDWCGLLFLNCPLKVSEVPEELKFLFEDIPPELLKAHHIRIDQNNVEVTEEGIGLKASSIFGLVDYKGPSLVNETGKVQAYRFTTTRLVLAVKNSSVSDFSSESELRINELFGQMVKKTPTVSGNCLMIDGTMQRNAGTASYSFALRESGNYILSEGEPQSVEIMEAVRTGDSFVFNGRFRFSCIPECDLLSYGSKDTEDGWLDFRKLLLVLNRETEAGGYMDTSGLVFDLKSSVPRKSSMAARFPLRLKSLLEESARGPLDLGYRSITCPISQTLIEGGFRGLVFEIPLGTLGKNSPVSGLTLNLLYAWGLDKEGKRAVFVGIKLPGMGPDGTGLRIQGIVKLDFKGIELKVRQETDGPEYQIILRSFTLQSFGLSFPPGKNQICILGEGPDKLGWYAAYADGQKKE